MSVCDKHILETGECPYCRLEVSSPVRWSDEDGCWVAVVEVGGSAITAHGETPEECWREWQTAAALVVGALYGRGFAAGVEAAINRLRDRKELAAELSFDARESAAIQGCIMVVGSLLPPDYKSPAQIRREALEEARMMTCTYCAKGTKDYIGGDGDLIHVWGNGETFVCRAQAIRRALAEGEE